jgi:hypothetical protein
MMVMTAKVNMKKTLILLGAIAAVIIAIILAVGGSDSQTTSAPALTGNDARVKFLRDFGWEVDNTPVESSQVRIPEQVTEVFDRYNQLQKSQGYDLSKLAGKNAMRYVYKVSNYPGATDPVYATVLIHKQQIVGGDVTDTSAKGKVQGFKMPKSVNSTTSSEAPSLPSQSTTKPTA